MLFRSGCVALFLAAGKPGEMLRLALTDPLTGLGNHRAFHEALGRLLEAVQAGQGPLAVALVDLDDFKSVNDADGHATGDELLAELARLLAKVMRRTDLAFRVGGDEFAILMPQTRADEGAMVVRRDRKSTRLNSSHVSESRMPSSA